MAPMHRRGATRAALSFLVLLLLIASPPRAVAQVPAGPVAAERVTIAFERGSYTIVSRVAITKVLPPSDALPEGPGPFLGFWFELRESDGSTRYRRVIGDPVLLVSETPDHSTALGATASSATTTVIERAVAVPDARTFTVLVPAPRPGEALLLFGVPYAPDTRGVMEAPQGPTSSLEVARFELEPLQ